MYSIYENAEGVLIWIGPSENDSDMGMDFITEIWDDPGKELFVSTEDGGFELNFTPRTYCAFVSLCRILTRPYFTRLWVVQEIAMASNPTIWCGRKRAGWTEFLAAVKLVRAFVEKFKDYGRDKPDLPEISVFAVRLATDYILHLAYHRTMQEKKHRGSLLHLALVTQWTNSTNPRDKIYGLWDLAKDTRLLNLKPNYDRPVSEVYIDFVKQHVLLYKNLDIICATQACDCSSDNKQDHVPSWCPDWRHKPVMEPLLRKRFSVGSTSDAMLPDLENPLYSAARGTRAAVGFTQNNRSLVCSSVCTDYIVHIVEHSASRSTGTFGEWRKLASKNTHRDHTPLPEDEIDEQFWSMLVGEANGVRAETSGMYMRINKIPEHLRLDFFERVENMIKARVLAFTSRGYMALIPFKSRVGMRVSILLGCSVPVLLDEHDDHVHFMGSCYVQGWMHGEMLDAMELSDEEIFKASTLERPIEIH